MSKYKIVLVFFIFVLLLVGCNKLNDKDEILIVPSTSGDTDNKGSDNRGNLNSKKIIKNYLVGEWVFDQGYVSDVVLKMVIDKDLKVNLAFYDNYEKESKGDYKGQLKLDRAYTKPNDTFDIIRIELDDKNYNGGDFFFLHRTSYDDKDVMGWFFAGSVNCVLEKLGPTGFESVPEEVIFEKITQVKTPLNHRINDEFHAVYWAPGTYSQNIWIDDVILTIEDKDDYAALYPRRMTHYKNELPVSVHYNIANDNLADVLGQDLFPGSVYLVKTDENGNITSFILEDQISNNMDDLEGQVDKYFKERIINFVSEDVKEIKKYLDQGMSILITDETVTIEESFCYIIALGTNHEDKFSKELFYAVNPYSREAFGYNVLIDTWVLVENSD